MTKVFLPLFRKEYPLIFSPRRVIAMILPLSTLLAVSCGQQPASTAKVNHREQQAPTTSPKVPLEKRASFLFQDVCITASTPKGYLIGALGKPDSELPDAIVYQLSQQYTGRVRSVRYTINQSGGVKSIDYLDTNGNLIVSHSTAGR